MTKVHYVIGIGRSGTSLLMSLLGAHQNLHTPPENYFNTFFKNAFQKCTMWNCLLTVEFKRIKDWVRIQEESLSVSHFLHNLFESHQWDLDKVWVKKSVERQRQSFAMLGLQSGILIGNSRISICHRIASPS